MTITEIGLVGAYEHFDETVRGLVQTNWTAANTNSETPTFDSATGNNVETSWPNVTGEGLFQVHFNEDDAFLDPAVINNGDTFHGMVTTIYIDLFARDANLLKLGQREINRILWEIAPRATPLDKTDATASPIHGFEMSEMDWSKVKVNTADFSDDMVHAATKLNCQWYKLKT